MRWLRRTWHVYPGVAIFVAVVVFAPPVVALWVLIVTGLFGTISLADDIVHERRRP